ncbi:MAG: DUF4365 domain-containing protein [Verrucomicrobiota bacterium JB022]|nr:DUF4365 domain-containing protein [Verrucomicrobiota bacterium JB022]
MELARFGLQVFTPEVDDHGIDFVARVKDGEFWEFQVKSVTRSNYVFMRKQHFKLHPKRFCILVLLRENEVPRMYLIRSTEWLRPNSLLCDRDYNGEGQKSAPEWGISLTKKNVSVLEAYAFEDQMELLLREVLA